MKLSLIVAYRKRSLDLKNLLEWFKLTSQLNEEIELIIIESDSTSSEKEIDFFCKNIKYYYVYSEKDSIFNKSSLLNLGLKYAKGIFITPFDVDLIPVDLSFNLHLKLSLEAKSCLVSGYRLNLKNKIIVNPKNIWEYFLNSEVPSDDTDSYFLKRQLIDKLPWGVIPFFSTDRLKEIGGWDEEFKGWGGEDQDVIVRYLKSDLHLIRCPELCYLHMPHDKSPGWNEELLQESSESLFLRKYPDDRLKYL